MGLWVVGALGDWGQWAIGVSAFGRFVGRLGSVHFRAAIVGRLGSGAIGVSAFSERGRIHHEQRGLDGRN